MIEIWQDCSNFQTTNQRLEDYIEKYEQGLITTVRNDTELIWQQLGNKNGIKISMVALND